MSSFYMSLAAAGLDPANYNPNIEAQNATRAARVLASQAGSIIASELSRVLETQGPALMSLLRGWRMIFKQGQGHSIRLFKRG